MIGPKGMVTFKHMTSMGSAFLVILILLADSVQAGECRFDFYDGPSCLGAHADAFKAGVIQIFPPITTWKSVLDQTRSNIILVS